MEECILFLERVKELVLRSAPLATDKERDAVEVDLQVSCITVLLEAALSDEHLHENEQEVIVQGISREFGVDAERARELFSETMAQHTRREDMSACLDHLVSRYDAKQRRRILALVKQVIEADMMVNEFETTIYGYIRERLELDK
jgi:uncharacterized tellurite resistance protein B-like protein